MDTDDATEVRLRLRFSLAQRELAARVELWQELAKLVQVGTALVSLVVEEGQAEKEQREQRRQR